jgi:hypothetical protein
MIKKYFHSLFLKILVFSVSIILLLVVYFYSFLYVPSQEKLIRANLFDRVKTIFVLSDNRLIKALQTHDDIMMLSVIENIMKLDDISTAYLLDNNCKVITHDKTTQWGKTYTDNLSKKAVATKKILRQKSEFGYLFSLPLTSSATLCVGISSEKLTESISSLNSSALIEGVIILLISGILLYGFIYLRIYPRYAKLNGELRSLELGGGGQ